MAKTKVPFLELAQNRKWIEKMLEHITSTDADTDKDDAAEWLAYYIGKMLNASFSVACNAVGTPLVQKMDEVSAEAMWSDANINVMQQRLIQRHLQFHS